MQVDYLFLIPLMPPEKLDAQRAALRSLCFRQLRSLGASSRVWLLGDANEEVSDFQTIKVEGTSKEDKLWEAGKILKASFTPPARYIVRLDDDDLINVSAFEAAANKDFDCFTDRYHQFYDLSSGAVSAQKRDWIPNTAIHKFEHAMQTVPATGGSKLAGKENFLFACDHSQAWHSYYADKKVVYSDKNNPLYLRVLNPGSITARENGLKAYADYLAGFGNWKAPFPIADKQLEKELKELWCRENGELKTYNFPKKTILNRLVQKISK